MYHYLESGLRNIWLKNGYKEERGSYGITVAIEDIEGLHQVIALTLTQKPIRLSGTEIRFLRKEMGLSQQGLGQILSVSSQSVAQWEKGKGKIQGPSDRLLRVLVYEFYKHNVTVRDFIEKLNELDRKEATKIIFSETKDGWSSAA